MKDVYPVFSFKDSDEIDEKYISYVVHAYNLKYIDGMEGRSLCTEREFDTCTGGGCNE
ncbi:MAG: hypothetical protein V8T43_07610 [Eubacteriales bacterium]